MIPNRQQCLILWDKFHLPSQKRIHVEEVTKLARHFASKFKVPCLAGRQESSKFKINQELVEAGAMLHDIDKGVKPQKGERHPDTAVRVLNDMGLTQVAEIVKKHPLHAILDAHLKPQTWEEKIVFLSDKMTKYEIIGVDARFKLWYRENLPPHAVEMLNKSYPLVKSLEQEILAICGLSWQDIRVEFNL